MNTIISIIQLQLLPAHGPVYFISILVHCPTFFTAFLEANSGHHTISSVITSECISKKPFWHVLYVLIYEQQFLVALMKETEYTDDWTDPELELYEQVQQKEKRTRDLRVRWILDSYLEGQKGGGLCKLGKRRRAKVKVRVKVREQLLGGKWAGESRVGRLWSGCRILEDKIEMCGLRQW